LIEDVGRDPEAIPGYPAFVFRRSRRISPTVVTCGPQSRSRRIKSALRN